MACDKVKIAGIAWYKREDYPALLKIFTDAHVLPDTFDEWLKNAQDDVRKFESLGITVVKAHIDPETFPAWCRDRGLDIDTHARIAFGDFVAARKYRNSRMH